MSRTKDETVTNGSGPQTRAEQGTREKLCRTVRLRGLTEIMFDRYAGDNDTQLEVAQKLYFADNAKTVALPAGNLMSFLSAQNTDSAPKKILDPRKYKKFCQAAAAFVQIGPKHIPFTRDGVPIRFGKFVGDVDPGSGIYIERGVARLPKGIPNAKVRPVLPLPWDLEFSLTLYPNPELQEQQLMNVFTKGGVQVGIGTNRPQYGKFEVVFWE